MEKMEEQQKMNERESSGMAAGKEENAAAAAFSKEKSGGDSAAAEASKDENETSSQKMTAEQAISQEQYPICEVAQLLHELRLPADVSFFGEGAPAAAAAVKEQLLRIIKENDMLPLYRKCCEEFHWKLDDALVAHMEKKHEEELALLEQRLEEAEEKYGDVEVREVLLTKANFYCRIGEVNSAVEAYEVAFGKTVGIGGQIDILLTIIRLGFVYGDKELIKKYMARAEERLETGGDWERRNKMKVYRGLHLITCRQLKDASDLLLTVLQTFPPCGLLSFPNFIFLTTLLALLTASRRVLREDVIHSPPVLEGADRQLQEFLQSFYYGRYKQFMEVLCPVARRVRRDLYLGRHYLYFIRAIRLHAYAQFLEPYKSVTVENMAAAFGVSAPFIEEEIGGFIASGKLSCRIDRVNAVIESNRPDERSKSYLQIVKQGDVLLNRIQKLSRVIAM